MSEALATQIAKPLPLLSIAETAEFFRSSRSSIYRMVERGQLKPVKIGGRTLFRRSDLDALVAQSMVA